MMIQVTVTMDVEVIPQATRISVPLVKADLESIAAEAIQENVRKCIRLNRLLDHPSDDIASAKVKEWAFYTK